MKKLLLSAGFLAVCLPAFNQISTLTSPCLGTFSRKAYFLEVEAIHDLRITGFSLMSQNCGTRDMSLYYKQGPSLGFESNPSAWTIIDSVYNFTPQCTVACPIPPTQIPFEFNVCIPAGTVYSFLIATTNGIGTIESNNLLTQGTIGAQDTNLILFSGMGHNDLTPFNANGSMVNSLTWQGEIFYQVYNLDLGNDTTICQLSSLALDPGAGYTSYQWSTGDTLQSLTVDTTGTYILNVTTTAGCILTDTINVTVVNCTVLPELPGSDGMMQSYPNPVSDNLIVNLQGRLVSASLVISDLTGRKILEIPVDGNNNELRIPVSMLPDGIYVMSLIHKDGTDNIRFIKSSE